jgi:hypothetical protein
MNENDLRDCFAMFALLRMSFADSEGALAGGAEKCYRIADAMLEARKAEPENDEPEVGIVAVKSRRKK